MLEFGSMILHRVSQFLVFPVGRMAECSLAVSGLPLFATYKIWSIVFVIPLRVSARRAVSACSPSSCAVDIVLGRGVGEQVAARISQPCVVQCDHL